MEQYQNALADMSNEAVEYVRGVPVVKTFGQTIFSFKRFKNAIDNYETWVIAYTKALRLPMMFYTTAINGVFAFLIAGGILFTRGGVTNELSAKPYFLYCDYARHRYDAHKNYVYERGRNDCRRRN